MREIGKIVNTHGIRGELRVLSNSDFVDIRFAPDAPITINNQPYIIESSYPHKNFIIIKLKGYNNINEVEYLKNQKIYAENLGVEVLADGEYFNQDLIGCDVLDQDGTKLGCVKTVVEGGAYNMLRIIGPQNGLIPFNKHFINEVDIYKKVIFINNIPGLLDEN